MVGMKVVEGVLEVLLQLRACVAVGADVSAFRSARAILR